jgi:hypothetical protein
MIGWPYQAILSELEAQLRDKKNPLAPNRNDLRQQVAQIIVDSYINYYQPYIAAGTSVDISACDLNEDEDKGIDRKATLMTAVANLASKLSESFSEEIDKSEKVHKKVRDAVILAHWRAQSYKKESYTDLWDFCDLLMKDFDKESSIYLLCEKVITAVEDMVTASRYYGPSFQHSHGLSIYFPWRESEELDEYDNLRFSGSTKWGAFLRQYLAATRRKRRGEEQVLGVSGTDVMPIDIPAMEEGAGIFLQMNKIGGPPARIGGPPARIGGPPARIGGPPARLGFLAKSPSMKNPPNGFLVNKNTKEEIRSSIKYPPLSKR